MEQPDVCNECACAFCEGKAHIIDLCPLHASAKALLEALEEMLYWHGGERPLRPVPDAPPDYRPESSREKAVTVIASAKGEN